MKRIATNIILVATRAFLLKKKFNFHFEDYVCLLWLNLTEIDRKFGELIFCALNNIISSQNRTIDG